MGMKMYKWAMKIWIKYKTAWDSHGDRTYVQVYDENLKESSFDQILYQ